MEEYNNILDNDTIQLPLVSICSITYNHAPFIRQCLDGFLMQKTNFKYEIIIHDDASTDGTAEIIKEYAEKYSDLITPIFQSENQYSKGIRGFYAKFVFPKAKGKYIAMCEGDDYWTDPLKLQKQVDFLESHPDYVMCTHGYDEFIQDIKTHKRLPETCSFKIDINTLIHYSGFFFQPLTLMYRYEYFRLEEYKKYENSRDTILFYYLLTKGNGYYMSEKMSIYRRHNQGIWTGITRVNQWLSDYNVRFSIYKVERSIESVIFIINLFFEDISRTWLFCKINIVLTIFRIVCLHFGLKIAFRVVFSRLLKKKNPFGFLTDNYRKLIKQEMAN